MEKSKGKDFLTRHIEKMVLGLFAVVTLFLLYQGFKLPDYTEKQQPQALIDDARRVKGSIDDPSHWEAMKEERVVKTEYETRVEKAQQPISTSHYATESHWDYKPSRGGALREDPELLAPGKPHMVGVLGAIAVQHPRERTYPLANLEEADPIEVSVRTRRSSARRTRGAAATSPYGQSGASSPYGGGEGVGGPPPGYGDAGAGASPYGSGGSPYPSGAGVAGASGAAASTARKVPKEYNEGFDVSQLTPATEVARVTPETAHFIAGTALVPHRKLVDAYKLAFENAQGVSAVRDLPTYWEFEVERADVTDKPADQLTDADWKKVITFSEFEKQYKRWAGTAADFTPAEYADPALTWPLPPLMLHDNLRFAVHPALPLPEPGRRGQLGGYGGLAAQRPTPLANEETDAEDTEGEEPADGDAAAAPQPPGARPGIGMGPRALGAGLGGAAGFGGAYGGGSPYGGGGESPYGAGGESPYGAGGGSPYGAGGGSPYGGGAGSPYGAGGGSPFGAGLAAVQPEHKLVRFYDFADPKNPNSPKPGRKYVYRVHIAVEDPNFPMNPLLQPPMRTLSPEVYARVSKKDLASKDDPTKRDPRLWSDWSEASAPVSLPDLTRVYVGPVQPADMAVARRSGQQGAQPVEYQRNPPQAEVVALQWDKALAANLIVPLETRPGTVLAKTTEAQVIDPMDLTVRKTESRRVNAQGVILDAFGGDELPLAEDEAITAPGILLMFDTQGKLQVLDEIDHMQRYRLYSFADEREAAEAAAERANAAAEGDSGYPGAGGGGAYPGGGGGGGAYPGGGGGAYPGGAGGAAPGGRGAAPGGNRRGR